MLVRGSTAARSADMWDRHRPGGRSDIFEESPHLTRLGRCSLIVRRRTKYCPRRHDVSVRFVANVIVDGDLFEPRLLVLGQLDAYQHLDGLEPQPARP